MSAKKTNGLYLIIREINNTTVISTTVHGFLHKEYFVPQLEKNYCLQWLADGGKGGSTPPGVILAHKKCVNFSGNFVKTSIFSMLQAKIYILLELFNFLTC